MNHRLAKKCFAASAGVHLLLLVVLFVGPAFLSSNPPPDNMEVLDFIPYKTVDAMVSGGGNPNAKPPPALPLAEPPKPLVQPTPQPAPEPKPQPQPEPEPVKPAAQPKPNPESIPDPSEKKPRKPVISTELVTRADDSKERAKRQAEQRAREAKEAADRRRRLASQLGAAAERIGSSTSSSTDIELKGPGGGGIPYANFLQAVKSRYANAWVVPDGVTDDDATTTASVTIARDGTVVTARITRHSGNVEVDRSVQRTLDEVKWAAPLPDDAREDQRTVSINFNVRAKKALG